MSGSICLEDKVVSLPPQPGVYLMKDSAGNVLYVGKGRSLRHRVQSYFQTSADHPIKTRALVSKTADLDFIITDTEKEALILESNLIKKYKPRYNVNLKDDKHYPYLKFTVNDPYPRLHIVRRVEGDGSLYFGPFPSARAVRETLHIIHKLFPICKCSERTFRQRRRPCFYYQLKSCLAPCCSDLKTNQYDRVVKEVILFLRGHDTELLSRLATEMEEEAKNLNFESAAIIRDQIKAVQQTLEKQKIITTRFVDKDVVAYFREDTAVEVFLLFIRQGRMVGTQSFSFRHVASDDEEMISSFIPQFYGNGKFIPDEIILPLKLENQETMEEWLSEQKGRKVAMITPLRGDQKNLLRMATENARLMWENRYSKEETVRRTEEQMRKCLHLERTPKAIECFDVSNLSGKEAVGSMVRFEDGEPIKQKYRHYKIATVDHADDYGMMDEIVKRRLLKASQEQDLPDLIIVDGGKGHLQVARQVMAELGIGNVDAIGLAKDRFHHLRRGPEKIFLPGRKNPVILSKHSSVLHLLQRIRDESHRFAITYHRKLRQKKLRESALDDIPGIGPVKRKNLLRHFGSVKNIELAGEEELSNVSALSGSDVRNVHEFFHGGKGSS